MRNRITSVRIVIATAVVAVLGALVRFTWQASEPGLPALTAAMRRMSDAMAAEPSRDVDRDFATMMIPHHQGAIDMAVAELRHGRNERLRRMAQAIVIDQQQEIAALKRVLEEELAPAKALSGQLPVCRAPLPY
jgi:hypothetical protein